MYSLFNAQYILSPDYTNVPKMINSTMNWCFQFISNLLYCTIHSSYLSMPIIVTLVYFTQFKMFISYTLYN